MKKFTFAIFATLSVLFFAGCSANLPGVTIKSTATVFPTNTAVPSATATDTEFPPTELHQTVEAAVSATIAAGYTATNTATSLPPTFTPTSTSTATTVASVLPVMKTATNTPDWTTVIPTSIDPVATNTPTNTSTVTPTNTATFTATAAPAGFPTVVLIPVSNETMNQKWFAGLVEDMSTSQHWGNVLRQSRNEIPQYGPSCSWDIAFDLAVSQPLTAGTAGFPNCWRFVYDNSTGNSDVVLQFKLRRAFTDWKTQQTYDIASDPYDADGAKPQGLFLGSPEGVTVWAQAPGDANPTQYQIKGGYRSWGGSPSTVGRDGVVYQAGEISADTSSQGNWTGKSGNLFIMDFPRNMTGDIVLTIIVPKGARVELWKGVKVVKQ